jgi:hypothetical protein
MKDDIIKDAKDIKIQASKKNDYADRLIEAYAENRKDIVGEKWIDSAHKNPAAIRRTAIALKSMEESIKGMTESTISSSFPIPLQNLLKVIRLTAPNMIYPEIYTAFQMQGWNDAIYYIDTVTGVAKRGASVGQKTYETALARFSTEVETATVDGTGATTNYTGTLGSGVLPLRPFKTIIYVGIQPVAEDNGAGVFTDARYGAGILSSVTPSTLVSSTGVYDITFATAPGEPITAEFNFDSEVSSNYDEIGSVDIRVRNYQFRPEPYYLGVSWSIMAEHQLKATLDQNIDEILTSASVDMIRQNKDIRALKFGYGVACKQAKIEWDANYVAANTYTMRDHLDTFTYAIDRTTASIYNTLNRGAINKMYGTSITMAILRQHRNFVADTSMLPIGPHKIGSINGIELFQVPNAVFTNSGDALAVNDIVCAYKDSDDAGHVGIAFGEFLPFASTMQLEYGNGTQGFTKEKGVYSLADRQVLEPRFQKIIRMKNIPAY